MVTGYSNQKVNKFWNKWIWSTWEGYPILYKI